MARKDDGRRRCRGAQGMMKRCSRHGAMQAVEAVFPTSTITTREYVPRGFRLDSPASRRPLARADAMDVLVLAKVRSHDRYNTTIYDKKDRYRGTPSYKSVPVVLRRSAAGGKAISSSRSG